MEFELCRRFGVTVVAVESLTRPAVYVEGQGIVLVRPDLDGPHAVRVAEWALAQALQERAGLLP